MGDDVIHDPIVESVFTLLYLHVGTDPIAGHDLEPRGKTRCAQDVVESGAKFGREIASGIQIPPRLVARLGTEEDRPLTRNVYQRQKAEARKFLVTALGEGNFRWALRRHSTAVYRQNGDRQSLDLAPFLHPLDAGQPAVLGVAVGDPGGPGPGGAHPGT